MSDTLDPNNPLFYPTIIQLAKKGWKIELEQKFYVQRTILWSSLKKNMK